MKKQKKEKNFKFSFIRPSFISSDGLIMITSIGVKVPKNKNGEPLFEQALREFKKVVKDSKVLDELKSRREFLKPSALHRKKMQSAKRLEKLRALDIHNPIL